MKWNIFNRVTVLEQQVKDLTDFSGDQNRMIARLEERVHGLENANKILVNSNQALIGRHDNALERLKNLELGVYLQSRQKPVFTNEVDEERLKKRQYQREWYAKKKAKKEEEGKAKSRREKKNAYARAYYARTKGAKQ